MAGTSTSWIMGCLCLLACGDDAARVGDVAADGVLIDALPEIGGAEVVPDTRSDETAVEDTRVEDTGVDDTRVDDTRVEDTRVEDTRVEDTRVDDTTEDTAVDDTTEDTRVDDTDTAIADTGTPPDDGPTRYGGDALHSPLTPAVVRHLAEVAARGGAQRDDVFMKVGDSITVARSFLSCLADPAVDLQGRADLAATRAFFAAADDLAEDAGLRTPFDRTSLSALGGKTAAWSVTASDGASPVERELAAIAPSLAVVMYGTNDIGYWPEDFPRMFKWYGTNMLTLVDTLEAAGVVPILSSIPRREDWPEVLDPRVPSLNALVWGIASTRQLPFVDFHRALAATPDGGLSGDGVHPRAACDTDSVRCGCRFDASGLEAGYNVRNWITLEALDRVRRVLGGAPPPDVPTRPPLAGRGTRADPYVIDALPFAARGDTHAGASTIARYACGAQDESGPEIYYRLDLAAETALAAIVIDDAATDVDVHVLAGDDPDACRARNDTYLETTLAPGRWSFVVDTWVNGQGVAQPGDYLFVVAATPDL